MKRRTYGNCYFYSSSFAMERLLQVYSLRLCLNGIAIATSTAVMLLSSQSAWGQSFAEVADAGLSSPSIADPEVFNAEVANAELSDAELSDAERPDAEVFNAEVFNAEIADAEQLQRPAPTGNAADSYVLPNVITRPAESVEPAAEPTKPLATESTPEPTLTDSLSDAQPAPTAAAALSPEQLLTPIQLGATGRGNSSALQALVLPFIPDLPTLEDEHRFIPEPNPAAVISLVIRLRDRKVYVYNRDEIQASFPIAIGRSGWETPTGEHEVLQMVEDPAWQNPFTGDVIPAGPDNPLGVRWIGFWTDGQNHIGFHGTPNESSVGQAASHGCIRMYNRDVVQLFELVEVGTPVTVEP